MKETTFDTTDENSINIKKNLTIYIIIVHFV